MKNIGGMFLKFILILFVWILAFLLTFIIIKGRGRAVKLLDKNGNSYENGISTREKVVIGGKEQYIFVTSENVNNPVLLFLHGGPGSPEIAMEEFEPGNRLEERFTVCYWEQRGSGLSYGAKVAESEMTLDLMVDDTIELTEYLRDRFGKEKIYIMGHSWGSFLGIKSIYKKPEYYAGYFGIGQVSNQRESERLGYEYLLKEATARNDEKAIKDLKKFDVKDVDFPTNQYIMSSRSKYMNKYGVGIKHIENYKMSELIKSILFFKGYSAVDFVRYTMGSLYSTNTLFGYVLDENLIESTNKFEVPVYILQGKYDIQVSHDLAKEYYEKLEAPDKDFITFENSAHSPNFEETEKFLEEVFLKLDKIEGVN